MDRVITELIERYERPKSFNYAAYTPDMQERVRVELGVSLPEQYLAFLGSYGHGGLDGFEVLGVGLDGSVIFLDETLEYREFGLPNNLVVIENCDEWLECIDCNTGEVVSWDMSGEVMPSFPSFDDFLLDRIENAVENM